MSYAAFLAVLVGALAYVCLKARTFDAFTVAVFAQAFYFFPLVVDSLPKSLSSSAGSLDAAMLRQPVTPGAYWLAAILVALTGLGAALLDFRRSGTAGAPLPSVDAKRPGWLGSVESWLLLIAAAGLAIQWARVGGDVLFAADKLVKMNHLGQGFAVFEAGAALAFVLAFNARNWAVFCGALILLSCDVYVGFRYMAVLSLLSIALLHLSRPGASVLLLAARRILLPAICVFLFFLVWPYLDSVIAGGKAANITPHIVLLQMRISLHTFEPFVTQTILDRVVASGFTCSPAHFLSLLTLVVPFGNLLGLNVASIGAQIQARLFPDAHYGVGSNILAEMLCSFGVPGVIVFSIAFAGALALLSWALRRTRGSWQAVLALEAVLLAFYIYRNDLYYLLLLARRVALVAILGGLAHWTARTAARRLLAPTLPSSGFPLPNPPPLAGEGGVGACSSRRGAGEGKAG